MKLNANRIKTRTCVMCARYRMAIGVQTVLSNFIGHKLMFLVLYSFRGKPADLRTNSIKRWKVFLETLKSRANLRP